MCHGWLVNESSPASIDQPRGSNLQFLSFRVRAFCGRKFSPYSATRRCEWSSSNIEIRNPGPDLNYWLGSPPGRTEAPGRANSKLEFSNVQNIAVPAANGLLLFGHLSFRDSVIVSNFDLPEMPLRRFRVVPQSECYCHRHYSLLKYFAWRAGIRISCFPACSG
jgi:hypothetical protein